jgi:outer membrane protein OmpA-like peptidoglycan-associated protein
VLIFATKKIRYRAFYRLPGVKVCVLFLGLFFFFPQQSRSQEGSNRRIPFVVSHLSSANSAVLRRKGAPKHNIISRVICFKKPCRAYIGWRKNQRSMRFRGYKKGGGLAPTPSKKPIINTPVNEDSIPAVSTAGPVAKDTLKTQESLLILGEVLFEINSADLNPDFTYQLDSLVGFLSTHPSYRVAISGHTDNIGNENHNLALSNARATAVASYLQENNIDQARLTFRGEGSSRPIASNQTAEGRKKNRRVEIRISH